MAQRHDGEGDDPGAKAGLSSMQHNALIVEDEFIIAEGLRVQLEDLGLSVCGIAATADEALSIAIKEQPTVVFMDVRLQGNVDGVDTGFAIRQEVGSKLIFVTGSREQSTIDRIEMHHTGPILFKPVSLIQLRRTIEAFLG